MATTKAAPKTRAKGTRKSPVIHGKAPLKSVPTGSFDLDQALQDMSEAFVQCRDFMHAWQHHGATYSGKDRTYRSTMRCQRCQALKIRVISQRGEILESHYDYPEGYLMPGSGRLDGSMRDKIRLRSIQGQMLHAQAEAKHA